MGNCSVKSICRRVLEPWPPHRHACAEKSPCMEPFPEGLGPLSVRATHLRASDVLVMGLDSPSGGTLRLTRRFFSRSRALRALEARLDRLEAWSPPLPARACGGCRSTSGGASTGSSSGSRSRGNSSGGHAPGGGARAGGADMLLPAAAGVALELRTSPSHHVNLPPAVFQALGLPLHEEVHFAWVYPVPFECTVSPRSNAKAGISGRSVASDRGGGPSSGAGGGDGGGGGDSCGGGGGAAAGSRPNSFMMALGSPRSPRSGLRQPRSPRSSCSPGSRFGNNRTYEVGAAGEEEEEELDPEDADVSFLTVGGYIYFRPSADFTDSRSTRVPLMRPDWPTELDLLSARSIRFSPAGALQFSAPRRWEPAWTRRLAQQGRFQAITARKWVAAGARYVCWVRPDEPLPDPRGKDRPLAHHGGFAFLFHAVENTDTEGLDRYFEVVAEPELAQEDRPGSSPTGEPRMIRRCTTSLPYNLAAAPPGHEARLSGKLLMLARRERWPLVRHLLAEYPHLAAAGGEDVEGGTTLLHVCAERDVLDAELLSLLKEHGASCEAMDALGRKPEELGGRSFRALVRSVWGLSPDLFEDPEGWFRFWDRNASGVLEPEELAAALSSAYRCNCVGAQWVKSFVNIHHHSGVSRAELIGEHGLLQMLQVSEEFAGLRQQRTPPLFRGLVRNPAAPTDEERSRLVELEVRLEHLRHEHGWEAGRPAPRGAMPLPLPAPIPTAAIDPEERMRTATSILSFSFEQTRGLPGRAWQVGFRIDFAGQEGLDDGGLTKAWVSEIAFALWADSSLFDSRASGSFFKPDDVEFLHLDGVPVRATDFYKWAGCFLAYALYQRCLTDCRLAPWAFRCIHRAAAPRHFFHPRSASPDWPDTPEGEDAMLGDLASLDYGVASNLWKVRHEMSEDDLRWLDFTCAGVELEPGGGDCAVTPESKACYVRLFCTYLLRHRSSMAIQAFVEGFFEVIPARLLDGAPEEGVLALLAGQAEVTDAQMAELERVVVPAGLVPAKLSDHPRVREAASWLFCAARDSDGAFRARLLEFWIGVGRVPLLGLRTVRPRPRLQVMVQPDGRGGVKRIASWPRARLPEGHTCGNELWMALPDSYAEAATKLKQAVDNFESGFALR
eukprot:TRINITY_DN19838_c0_g1_i1.p1 TRINITY_DN19838_c0_g1~~TRINITY_DN19838_c0_g1_i1.p1  ORF type:complete len:1125 (+),score=142.50 TRINITY_DN19838_c0_g1_i1:80-3454(+)